LIKNKIFEICISWVRFELGFGSILIIFIFYSLCKIILKKVYLFGLDRVRLIFIKFRLNCYGYVLQFYNQNYFFISWFRLWLSHSTMDKKLKAKERKNDGKEPSICPSMSKTQKKRRIRQWRYRHLRKHGTVRTHVFGILWLLKMLSRK